MKKIITVILSILMVAVMLSGCGNKDLLDTNYTFNKAIIKLQDISIEVDVKQWADYEDGDQVQIIDTDGNVYFTSSVNVLLIRER